MFNQIYLLPEEKQSVIISSKCGIYKLPYQLPINKRLGILETPVHQRHQENLQIS